MQDQETLDAFWVRVQVNWEDLNDCWEWQGRKTQAGYGSFGGRAAHRVSWEIANKRPIPSDLLACHHCDNKGCVNPWHIFLGTNADNIRDLFRKGGLVDRSRYDWLRKASEGRKVKMRTKRPTAAAPSRPPKRASAPRKPTERDLARARRRDETATRVREIRAKHRQGVSLAKIGAEYGLTRQGVSWITTGKGYKWVKEVPDSEN